MAAIPKYPQAICGICGFLLAVLIVDMILRENKFQENGKGITVTLGLDFLCSLGIIYMLDFNYNGVLLLVAANAVVYIKDRRWTFFMLSASAMIFLVADYELISVTYDLYSVRSYIQYYSGTTQQFLLGAYNVLISANILIFILYCVNIILSQSRDIEEAKKRSENLQTVNTQLKQYNQMTEKMAEARERNRMAREIHDTLGHTLTGISAGVDACVAIIDENPEQTKKQLELVSKAVRGGIQDVRRSVSELRADALERFQLEQAIQDMISQINSLAGVQVYFKSNLSPLKFSEDEENVIYRIIQEGITNAIRHGHADCIWVDAQKEDGILKLKIKDNGIGCKEMKKGFGTKHMKERVNMLGGTISFSGENGFLIDAQIPIRWGEEYD
ncbi:MAG: sensor histidine kinase [Muricomes sp.]